MLREIRRGDQWSKISHGAAGIEDASRRSSLIRLGCHKSIIVIEKIIGRERDTCWNPEFAAAPGKYLECDRSIVKPHGRRKNDPMVRRERFLGLFQRR